MTKATKFIIKMGKIKLLSIAVFALLFLNCGILGYLLLSKKQENNPPENRHQRPKTLIIEKLKFDASQIENYELLIDEHRAKIRLTEDKIRKSKNELYQLLKENNVNENDKNAIIDSLANYQKQIELIHFDHFQQIKKLCKKEQLGNFNSLTNELSRMFSKKGRPRDNE